MQVDLVLYNIGQLVTSRELDKTKKMDNIEQRDRKSVV